MHETVADECKGLGITNALITTTGLKGTGVVDEIKAILNHQGVATTVFSHVSSNPKDYQIMEAYEAYKQAGCDGVVSVGGGSSHDCGKGVRAVSNYGGLHIREMSARTNPGWLERVRNSPPVSIPQICVNTTAGSGAETSAGAAFTDTQARLKMYTPLPGLPANVALIDPLLVRLMPSTFAAWTGFDALTHAFESFLSKSRSQHNIAMQIQAMKLISSNLREFVYNRMNHEACENMCWAESLSIVGIHMAGGVGIVHGLGDGLSVLCNVHHGRSSAVMAVPLERYNQPACPGKFAEMAAAMGVDIRGLTVSQASDKWFGEIGQLLLDLGIETGHLNRQFGLKREDLEHIATQQYSAGLASRGNPRAYNAQDCIALLENLL